MSKRTTTLAAGLIALSLPLSVTAEAAPLYRFDQPRSRSNHATIPPTEAILTDLSQAVSAVLDESERDVYAQAVEDAEVAIMRAGDVLDASRDENFPLWQVKLEATEAEIGLEAAGAHVSFARNMVGAESLAAITLDAISFYIADLLDDIRAL